jgi:adenine-specific DNA-methyltransferase
MNTCNLFTKLFLIKELLIENGILCFHCDWHKSHHLRCILDEVFGQTNFVNEVSWQKIRVAKSQSKSFGNVHDTIFVYNKGAEFIYNKQFTEQDESYISKFNKIEKGSGKKYQLVSMIQAGQGEPRRFGKKILHPGVDRHWIWSQERIDEAMKLGLIEFTENGNPRKKQYYEEEKGKDVTDIWTDIFPVNSQALEDTKYPTQKPESLLERIVLSFSNPGDIVLDCFMGSGTSQAVSLKLGRRFIGADINLGAIQTTTKRLINLSRKLSGSGVKEPVQLALADEEERFYGKAKEVDTYYYGFAVYNVNHYDIFRNPIQAKELLVEALEVQPYPNGSIWDGEKDGRKVKIMPINRIATKADLNEIIANIPWKEYEKKHSDSPTKPVDYITLVCMGHEPDLAGALQMALNNIKIDIEVVDILRDKTNLEFKRDSEAKIEIKKYKVVVKNFYPMNLLQKLSLMKKDVEEWRELVDSVMIDFNYDGAVFTPSVVDVPEGDEMVIGEYEIPENAGNIKIKITDLLSETFEKVIEYGNQ